MPNSRTKDLFLFIDFYPIKIKTKPIMKIPTAISKAYYYRELYWPSYTWPTQNYYLAVLESGKQETLNKLHLDEPTLRKHLWDLFAKLNSSFYHLQKLKESEDIALEIGSEISAEAPEFAPEFKDKPGVLGLTFESIGYEYESFLIATKSCLDILSILIAKSTQTGSDSADLKQLLENLGKKDLKTSYETDILKIFSNHSGLIDHFKDVPGKKSKRNYAVHRGSLPVGTINIPLNNPQAPVVKSKVMDLDVPTDSFNPIGNEDLRDYCERIFYELCDLVISSLEITLDQKFEKGEKLSVAEVKQKLFNSQKNT